MFRCHNTARAHAIAPEKFRPIKETVQLIEIPDHALQPPFERVNKVASVLQERAANIPALMRSMRHCHQPLVDAIEQKQIGKVEFLLRHYRMSHQVLPSNLHQVAKAVGDPTIVALISKHCVRDTEQNESEITLYRE